MTGSKLLTNVLIIDDSAAARATMAKTLRLTGYGVFELSSAIGATRTILRNDIAAAIIDLSMPGLSGDKLVGLLRTNPRLQKLVVIVVSGEGSEELERIARECKVNAVLNKRDLKLRLVPLLESLLRARGHAPPKVAGVRSREG